LLLFPSISFSAQNSLENDLSCYGFVIPLPQGKDTSLETFQNSKVHHLINDLLRENITVYWANNDFSAKSQSISLDKPIEMLSYKKGAFIIPFSDNIYTDALITAVILDYNYTNELDNQSHIHNNAYLLMQDLTFSADKLVEPKIVQYLGKAVQYGWPTYLEIADAGGFLTFEYLLDNEISTSLNNEKYNLLVWPYAPNPATIPEKFVSLINPEAVNTIRQFVRSGGGFVGTCYGAYAASSGLINPYSIFSVRYAHNPNLQKFIPGLTLSLSDSLMVINPAVYFHLYISVLKVINTNHPLFFGVNNTVEDFFENPVFIWLGENTHPLAVLQDLKPAEPDSIVSERAKKTIIGKPLYVNSTFGKGKMILYASHPDFVNNIRLLFENREWNGDPYYGRRIIHNSFFYVCSIENISINTTNYYNQSFISLIIEKTRNITFYSEVNNEFNNLYLKFNQLSDNISRMKNLSTDLQNLFQPLENNSEIFANGHRIVQYNILFCDIYQGYIDRAKNNLSILEKIIPMLSTFDNSINNQVHHFKNNLYNQINETEAIISKAIKTSEDLKEKLMDKKISWIEKITLINDRRNLLQTFETCLKYIPQTYFATLQLVRHFWYEYEASYAIAS
jgi:hypothetical protein